MRIEIGKKAQTIIVFLFLIGAASAISEYGNNINIPGNIDAVFGNFTNVRGNGSGIFSVNASNLTIGTIPSEDRLPNSSLKVINASRYATIWDAINASSGEVYIPAGRYDTPAFKVPSNILLRGAGNATVLNFTSCLLLPGNTDNYCAAIQNKNYNASTRNVDKNIRIESLTIIPSVDNGVGIALGGVDGINIENLAIDMTQGYRAIDFEASENVKIRDNTVTAPYQRTIYNYGIGSGLAGISNYVGSRNVDIVGNFIINLTGDSLLSNSGDTETVIRNNFVKPSMRPSIGHFDLFVDIEGQVGSPAKVILENNIFVTYGDSTSTGGGYGAGGNGHIVEVVFRGNVVDNTACKQTACELNGFGADGTNVSNTYIIESNVLKNVNNTGGFAGVKGRSIIYRNNYMNGSNASRSSFILQPTDTTVAMIVENNVFENLSLLVSGGGVWNNLFATQNRGFSPYDWGNLADQPSAYGRGDRYYNTTSNVPCFANNAGQNWVGYLTGDGSNCI